jgi:hypothetical protein
MYNRETESGRSACTRPCRCCGSRSSASEIDRKKIRNEIATGAFPTIFGTLKFRTVAHRSVDGRQWQNSEVVGVYPAQKPNAQALLFPKPVVRS